MLLWRADPSTRLGAVTIPFFRAMPGDGLPAVAIAGFFGSATATTWTITGAGGTVTGGTATVSRAWTREASGGIASAGTVDRVSTWAREGSGGAETTGSGALSWILGFVGEGGVVASGGVTPAEANQIPSAPDVITARLTYNWRKHYKNRFMYAKARRKGKLK